MDPDLGQYRHFCGTIIYIRTDKNPNKRVMYHDLRRIHSSMDGFYIKKVLFVEDILVPKKDQKYLFL